MKRHLVIIAILLLTGGVALAQEQEGEPEGEKPKTGWAFTPLPNVGYSTDTGVTLGLFSDFYYYGDGSAYPNFLHHLGFAGAYATKGSWYIHAYGDSPTLIPGVRLNGTLTYRDAMVHNFYGFNGIASPYLPELDANVDTRTAWYTTHRRFFRATATFMGDIVGVLDWMGGAVVRHVIMDDFMLDRYDRGNSLLLTYRDVGLIRADEFAGGTSLEFKGGLVYDSRDIEASPGKGFYAELYLTANTDLSRWKIQLRAVGGAFPPLCDHFSGSMGLCLSPGAPAPVVGRNPLLRPKRDGQLVLPVRGNGRTGKPDNSPRYP